MMALFEKVAIAVFVLIIVLVTVEPREGSKPCDARAIKAAWMRTCDHHKRSIPMAKSKSGGAIGQQWFLPIGQLLRQGNPFSFRLTSPDRKKRMTIHEVLDRCCTDVGCSEQDFIGYC